LELETKVPDRPLLVLYGGVAAAAGPPAETLVTPPCRPWESRAVIENSLPDAVAAPLTAADVAELVVLQRCCWVSEAVANRTVDIPPLHESHADVAEWIGRWDTIGIRLHGRLVAAVRARLEGTEWEIGRLMVAPDLAGRGIGSRLLRVMEERAPAAGTAFTLFTGAKSDRNISVYERAGYRVRAEADGLVFMTKLAGAAPV
jgi:GNAT superfamily N-acetyltransferase